MLGYPEVAKMAVFNDEKFVNNIGNLMVTRKYAIGDINDLTEYLKEM